jgi:IS5 family transposase
MANIKGLFLANLAEAPMRRKRRIFQHSNTQGYPLRDHIDLHHPLVELADMIDWAAIDRVATEPFQPGPGRPILRPRLVAGLLYLQHAFNLSDEQVVAGWLENPYIWTVAGEQPLFL